MKSIKMLEREFMIKTSSLDLVNSFLDYLNIRNDNNYLGTIFYGSYRNGLENNDSDLDLIIVYKTLDNEIKGYSTFNNVKFEYYKRSIASLKERVLKEINEFNDASRSIIGHGILIDDKGPLLELQKYTLMMFKKYWPRKIDKDDILYRLSYMHKVFNYLKRLYIDNDPYFNIYYGIALDKLRRFYQEVNGLSSVGTSKVYKVYNNKNVCLAQFKQIPNKKFVKLFNNCVTTNDSKKRLHNYSKLYEYVIKSYKVDFNKIEINLKGREY